MQGASHTGGRFLGALSDPSAREVAEVVLFGMPMDWTASYRAGSRLGPTRIRESSIVHEEYSPYLQKDLSDRKVWDAGDLVLPYGNVEKSMQLIRTFVEGVLLQEAFPLGMGGEHLVSWPIIQSMAKAYPDLAVIHIDAHADLRSNYEGEPYSHATPMYHVSELIGGHNLFQLGIRSMTREEVAYVKATGIHFHPFSVYQSLRDCLPLLVGRPVYVSIDIDVLDPAYAPGTGTPEPGGITTRELLESIHAIARSQVTVVGADLVEVAPAYDHAEQTVITASKCIREMLLGFTQAAPS